MPSSGGVNSWAALQKSSDPKGEGADFVRLNDLEYGTARYTPEPPETTGLGRAHEGRTLQVDKVNYTVSINPNPNWPLDTKSTTR